MSFKTREIWEQKNKIKFLSSSEVSSLHETASSNSSLKK